MKRTGGLTGGRPLATRVSQTQRHPSNEAGRNRSRSRHSLPKTDEAPTGSTSMHESASTCPPKLQNYDFASLEFEERGRSVHVTNPDWDFMDPDFYDPRWTQSLRDSEEGLNTPIKVCTAQYSSFEFLLKKVTRCPSGEHFVLWFKQTIPERYLVSHRQRNSEEFLDGLLVKPATCSCLGWGTCAHRECAVFDQISISLTASETPTGRHMATTLGGTIHSQSSSKERLKTEALAVARRRIHQAVLVDWFEEELLTSFP